MKSVLVSVLVAALGVPGPGPGAVSEWSQPGFGPGATYYNPYEVRLTEATTSGLRLRWEVATHGEPVCELGREPLVSGGLVYTTDAGGVGAYEPVSGVRRWHAGLAGRGVTRMALAEGRLITLTYACEGQKSFLTAFSAGSGTQLWDVPLGVPVQDMVVDRGYVVVDSRPDFGLATTAYRLVSGVQAWRLTGTRGNGLRSVGGRVLLRTEGLGSRAVAIATGGTIWQTPEDWYAVGSDPGGSRFYVGGRNGGLTAVNAQTGAVLWRSAWSPRSVAADERRVYFARHRSTIAVDAGTGEKLWSVHLPDAAGQPVRAGTLLYSPSGIGAPLSIVDAATGRAVPGGGMPSDQQYPPAVADGRLFLTDGGRLRAYF